jgi:hypothetical protein
VNPRAFAVAHSKLSAAPAFATIYKADEQVDIPTHASAKTAWCKLEPPRQGEGSDTHDRVSVFIRCGATNLEIARAASYAAHEALRGAVRSPTGFTLDSTLPVSSDGPEPRYDFLMTFRYRPRRFQP